MQRIAVIDYGMGNLRSVSRALQHVAPQADVMVSDDATIIESADRIVCPGQGAAADCMNALRSSGMDKVVANTIDTRPFLGICMGLQVLLTHSEENGGIDCLNLLPGRVRRFDERLHDADGRRLKVPHMGWSRVQHTLDHPLWQGIEADSRFYFAHSYYAVPDDAAQVVGITEYGTSIGAALAHPGFFACQFHPEKSAHNGLTLLANFTRWNGDSC